MKFNSERTLMTTVVHPNSSKLLGPSKRTQMIMVPLSTDSTSPRLSSFQETLAQQLLVRALDTILNSEPLIT
jgi:hypothetical protein